MTLEKIGTFTAKGSYVELTGGKTWQSYRHYFFVSYVTISNSNYFLGTTMVTKEYMVNPTQVIVCYNDGTLRKGQIGITSTTKATAYSGTGDAWSNISGIILYGAK